MQMAVGGPYHAPDQHKPDHPLGLCLTLLHVVAVFIAFAIGSEIRLAANPAEKLLPAPVIVWDTAVRLITQPDQRSGRILFWRDTWVSLKRLGLGIGISASVGLIFGLLIGLLPREALGRVSKVTAEGICGIELVKVAPPYDQSETTALMGTRVIVDVLGSLIASGKLGAHKRQMDKPVDIPHGAFEGKRWSSAT